MDVTYGNGTTKYGPGVNIELSGNEVAIAIDAYLVAHGIHVQGARTISVNGNLCESGKVYVDPSGSVVSGGERFSGRGKKDTSLYDATADVLRDRPDYMQRIE